MVALADWLAEKGNEDPLIEMDAVKPAAENIATWLIEFDTYIEQTSAMGAFYNNYLQSVAALLSFVRAERSDWQLY